MTERLNRMKRKILIVEDNELNREILAALLEEEYEVLTAENGEEGIQVLSNHYEELSLIILDVYMPICNGFEFLERTQPDPLLSGVPVIVATGSDKPEDEAKCLRLGASDFVTKPYNPEVVLGRVRSIIKLKESVATLSEVEYDHLTGLYTMPAFYHHVQSILMSDPEKDYHLSVIDLQGFKMINSIYGEAMGDRVLQYISQSLRHYFPEVPAARQGDKFFIFYTAEDLPADLDLSAEILRTMAGAPVTQLVGKVGIYRNVERNVPVSILCDRVMLAASSIKKNFAENIAYYDDKIQKRLLQEQYMENAFDAALEKEEFVVWYQPKVDTQSEKIVAAEALVRWIPEDGQLMPPYIFIPLFERDGLVSRLDEYVFRHVCLFLKKRMEAHQPVVPVSINLSRNSIYQPNTVENYVRIADELGVPKSLVPIELTESASIDGKEVLKLMNRFNAAGFALHMDDFGTGYSSLSSLTSMPFDVVKLDKSLIDKIGNNKGNTVIRHMVNIAQEMGMKLVAEGVETRAQVDFLKKTGCDMIQGYYFSAPRDQRVFEDMLNHLEETVTLDLDTEYRRINISSNAEFELDEKTMSVLEQVAEGMMEGFFIYRATSDETLLYANRETLRIFGCDTMQEFRKLTSNSFRGIVHPDDYVPVEKSIFKQINQNEEDSDAVEYHIVRRDGSVGFVKDKGHCVHTETYGNIFYVFIEEDQTHEEE